MPWGLTRLHQSGQSHFVTFCCYHRRRLLTTDASRRIFESALERVRRSFRLSVYGYVVMAGWPTLCATRLRLPLDKSEGVVKTEISWAVREHRLLCQRRLRTKTLEISPESLCGGVVPPTIDST